MTFSTEPTISPMADPRISAIENIGDNAEILIAVMGATGSGKTTFINLLSGSNLQTGHGLKSCTSVVQIATRFEISGRRVTLIDTPGFDDTTKSDTDVLKMISAFLATTYEHGKMLAGVIYIHRISDFRMGGISTRNFKMFRKLCGEDTLKNVVIVTNMWGEVSKEIGEAREAELISEDMFFKPVLDKGARLLRHENTLSSAQTILGYLLNNHPMPLLIQHELVDIGMEYSETAAASELNRELMAQAEKHEREMKALQEEMEEAIRTRDEETRKELEIESKRLTDQLNQVRSDSEALLSSYGQEKARLEQHINYLNACAERDAAQAALSHSQEIYDLERRLAETASASAAENARISRELEELRQQRNNNDDGGGCVLQ